MNRAEHMFVTRPLVLVAVLAACGGSVQMPPPDRPEPAATRPGIVPPPGPYAPDIDVRHYSVTIELPDSGMHIEATAHIDLRARAAVDSLWFDLTGLRVQRIEAQVRDEKVKPASFTQDSARVHIKLPERAASGDSLRLTIVYDGAAAPGDGLIIRKNVHGDWGAFADNWPDRARFWLPVIDHPSDKATVEFQVRAPAAWEVVANGVRTQLLDAPADVEQKRVWRWRIDQPIPTYLMVIGATNFAIGTVDRCARGGNDPAHPDGCVPVTYYTFPRDSANGARLFRRAGEMLAFYSTLIAPFPYPQLAHVQSSTRFGGMENAGAIFYSERAVAEGRLGEGTVAHETAHQWFGDAVTPGHWSHVWLSEGFATYFGNLYFERADSVQRFREMTTESWRGYLEGEDTDLAIVDTIKTPGNDLLQLLNSNTYNKGGAVLHMLRGLLGDGVFFAGIRRYYQRHVHGTALTRDLQRALEEESGRDLGWFFQQWVFQPGHPILQVNQTWDAAAGEAVITVEQVQKAGWPTFRFPLELAFSVAGNEIRQRFQINGRTETVRLRLAGAPQSMRVDPDGWLLHQRRQ
jgi:aminopeptidase N